MRGIIGQTGGVRGAVAVFAVAVAAAAPAAAAPAKGPDHRLAEQLQRSAKGSVAFSTKRSTGHFGSVTAGRHGDLLPVARGDAAQEKARRFLAEYGQLLGVERGSRLEQVARTVDGQGDTHVTYAQTYEGLPVFGAQVKAHVDATGALTAVNGVAVPDIDLAVTPRRGAQYAGAIAVADVEADPPEDTRPAGVLRAGTATLLVYRTGLIRGAAGSDALAYQVDVTDGAAIRERVFVHANAGKVLNRYSLTHAALHRVLHDQTLDRTIWQEGDPFPGALTDDQRNIVDFTGDTYRLFRNTFGRDSYDGAGAPMRAIADDHAISCPNAYFGGEWTGFCNGVTADDVVAHEWGHGISSYTHGLVYQWQPGALNESYSDIWGEVVDLVNGKGTDTPGASRPVGACSTRSGPRPVLRIDAPAEITGECAAAAALFGPPLTATGTNGAVVLGAAADGATTGCDGSFTADLAGKVALIDRGACSNVTKVGNAQAAGAIAVIVANNQNSPQTMSGSDASITIPSLMIGRDHRDLVTSRLAAGETVVVTLAQRTGDVAPIDTVRWLMGEDAPAVGSAVRDMWNPTCLSDPGKVSDAEYQCDISDFGGAHTNSGVPNHGFALLVDGGTYNGHTVAGLGLTKAAHLYWRAQTVYQTPTTDFADHADALEASCRDLIGVPLEALSTDAPAGPSGETLATTDCGTVAAMAAAVELRTSPAEQCRFTPLLQPGSPALCGGAEQPKVIYAADFEHAKQSLAGWTLTNEGRFAGWPGLDWEVVRQLPEGRQGAAVKAVDPAELGNCDGGAGDVSGVLRLTSPVVRLPHNKHHHPWLTFSHYVATEAGYDGGNLKVSLNGGPFELLPATAFTFNAYNDTLASEANFNTNPLAGEPAFTGGDSGQAGSWGESQVDLAAAGARPGDAVRIRFDMGMDGCGGIDGWYVDDVEVKVCRTAKKSRSEQTAAGPDMVRVGHVHESGRAIARPRQIRNAPRRSG